MSQSLREQYREQYTDPAFSMKTISDVLADPSIREGSGKVYGDKK
jgi:hypothetical protein